LWNLLHQPVEVNRLGVELVASCADLASAMSAPHHTQSDITMLSLRARTRRPSKTSALDCVSSSLRLRINASELGRHYQQYPDEYADADDEHGNEIYPTEPHGMSLSGAFSTRHYDPSVLQV
jgi:hypothetical protein